MGMLWLQLGITNTAVKSHLDGMEVVSQVRLDAINNLIKANKLAILVDSRDPRKNMFKLPNQAEINRYRSSDFRAFAETITEHFHFAEV